jgi:hypothetical protein
MKIFESVNKSSNPDWIVTQNFLQKISSSPPVRNLFSLAHKSLNEHNHNKTTFLLHHINKVCVYVCYCATQKHKSCNFIIKNNNNIRRLKLDRDEMDILDNMSEMCLFFHSFHLIKLYVCVLVHKWEKGKKVVKQQPHTDDEGKKYST